MPIYRGRFAPSPTGPLHFGSLFAAVISYLEAHYHGGQWFIRIEDVDPLREQVHAAKSILHTLRCHELVPDETPVYQSSRYALYKQQLAILLNMTSAYACPCSRKYLQEHRGKHREDCQQQNSDINVCALKYKTNKAEQYTWCDGLQGKQSRMLTDDFALQRKEGFYAYQLAVVCDDIEQNITHVVRGFDLIDSTPMQLALYKSFKAKPPKFSHFPVITSSNGQKLSKQNLAPAVNNALALENLLNFFSILGLRLRHPPDNCKNALNEALECWCTQFLVGKSELRPDSHL